jgi:imidazole glycerol-phosphate synthase subunit HisH
VELALVDYGAGNLSSVVKGLTAVGAEVRVISGPGGLEDAAGIVIPGVGHFGTTASLGPDWRDAVGKAIDRGRPVLGICLGLQWLFHGSAEAPDVTGLGLLEGECFRLRGDVKVPHVGWNTLEVDARSRLLIGLPPSPSAYFTHSFAAPIGPETVAATTHGVPFAAAVEQGRIFGVQFHPEKSGRTGLRILENFLAIVRKAR